MAPELADLRIELCPSHMSEGCFWKIYFVLLHPKLTKEEAELLSTPQVISLDFMLHLGHNGLLMIYSPTGVYDRKSDVKSD